MPAFIVNILIYLDWLAIHIVCVQVIYIIFMLLLCLTFMWGSLINFYIFYVFDESRFDLTGKCNHADADAHARTHARTHAHTRTHTVFNQIISHVT